MPITSDNVPSVPRRSHHCYRGYVEPARWWVVRTKLVPTTDARDCGQPQTGVRLFNSSVICQTPRRNGHCRAYDRHHHALHLRVVRNQPPVALVNVPIDIALVMLAQQHGPFFATALVTTRLVRATVNHAGAALRAAEGIGPGVNRIAEDLVNRAVNRQPPLHRANLPFLFERGQRERFLAESKQYLTYASQFGEFTKHESERFADARVRMLFDVPVRCPHVSDR